MAFLDSGKTVGSLLTLLAISLWRQSKEEPNADKQRRCRKCTQMKNGLNALSRRIICCTHTVLDAPGVGFL